MTGDDGQSPVKPKSLNPARPAEWTSETSESDWNGDQMPEEYFDKSDSKSDGSEVLIAAGPDPKSEKTGIDITGPSPIPKALSVPTSILGGSDMDRPSHCKPAGNGCALFDTLEVTSHISGGEPTVHVGFSSVHAPSSCVNGRLAMSIDGPLVIYDDNTVPTRLGVPNRVLLGPGKASVWQNNHHLANISGGAMHGTLFLSSLMPNPRCC